MKTHTPGPWKPCRSHEDFNGPYYDIELCEIVEYATKPFVRIESPTKYVAAAHDLFEFENADAYLMAAAPEMLAALKQVLHDSYRDDDGDFYIPYQADDKGNRIGDPLAIIAVMNAIAKAEGLV